MKLPQLYISLKWKSVVFVSIVLMAVTVVWVWMGVVRQMDTFYKTLEDSHQAETRFLQELVDDTVLKLTQFAQLIAAKEVVREYLADPDKRAAFHTTLEQEWLSYNINLGLDFLAVYNADASLLGELRSAELKNDSAFVEKFRIELQSSLASGEPRDFLYCRQSCFMVVLEPFIDSSGRMGLVALAQNLSDMVRLYYEFTGSDLGVLIEGDSPHDLTFHGRYLKNWDVYAWAVSDFSHVFPILKTYSASFPVEGEAQEIYQQGGHTFYLRQLQHPRFQSLGREAYFLSINDVSSAYRDLNSGVRQGVWAGLMSLLIVEVVMLLLIHKPMKRLVRLTNALHLLPEQKFGDVLSQVPLNELLVEDELRELEKSTVYVARELDMLHKELDLKSDFLKGQIYALTRSRAFLTRLFDNAQIFIVTHSFEHRIRSGNRKFESLYDTQPENFRDLIVRENERLEFERSLAELSHHIIDSFQQEVAILDRHGTSLIITWNHALVEDEEGEEIVLSVGMDQTQQKKAENDLRWMANHDGLTGLGNRRSFNTAFDELLREGRSGALVFIDVNRFKQINDIYGHHAGDEVLIDIAQQLRKQTRLSDVISRFAGDEFTVLLADVDAETLPALLSKLAAQLSGQIRTNVGQMVNYSVSIGAALFPDHGHDSQSLVMCADIAMYNAKSKGLGFWHVFDAADERVVQIRQDHTLLLTIRHALKNEAFSLVYQPITEIGSSHITHYEVLLRMQDEKGNTISPGLFIPLAEKTGEIRQIDEWVLDRACRALKGVGTIDEGVGFSINISAPTLQADDFCDLVMASIRRHGVDPSRIIIELTETAYIENFQQVLNNLRQIVSLGVQVALDDFGVGFSSFNYLKMLPLNYVKLDGSYIRGLVRNRDDQVFVRSMAAMIDAFGMKTIAEFVEDQATMELLSTLGVTHGQGNFIGLPMPFDHYFGSVR